jgi:hypothetical protein
MTKTADRMLRLMDRAVTEWQTIIFGSDCMEASIFRGQPT